MFMEFNLIQLKKTNENLKKFNSYLDIILFNQNKDRLTQIYKTMKINKYQTIFFSIIIILITIFIFLLGQYSFYPISPTNQSTINDSIEAEVLLIYVYSSTHSHAYGNLRYFIKNAVQENDGVDYYFILQGMNNRPVDERNMPIIPRKNAHYIQHDNVCFDFGTVGWFLKTYTIGNPWINQTETIKQDKKKIDITKYKYFIFMNSSVRGPFFPPYFLKFLSDYQEEFNKLFSWYYIFTRRINSKVKLVGCTISCIPIPHVQSYVLVTDFIGLKIMLEPGSHGGSIEGGIFGCFDKKEYVSQHSELATSNRLRNSGYMIDSLLTKYQNVNFNEQHNELCNGHKNPYLDDNLDGTPLEPYEVVFIKYNDLPYLQITKKKGELYERWRSGGN